MTPADRLKHARLCAAAGQKLAAKWARHRAAVLRGSEEPRKARGTEEGR